MQLISIEPTPNPNSMKLNLGESLPPGVSHTYTTGTGDCPDHVAQLLRVPGVKSLFHMGDFIAVQRDPRVDWRDILAGVRRAFGSDSAAAPQDVAAPALDEGFGEVRVEVQMFRGIPMLVKVAAGTEMHRQALPARFTAAVQRASPASPNMLAERRWVDQGARYGNLQQIAQEVAEELAAAFDDARLEQLVQQALAQRAEAPAAKKQAEALTQLPEDPDWHVRYAALEQTAPRPAAIPLFVRALRDPQSSIRRLAVIYLGLTRDPAAVPPLCGALADATAAVRRTAGDALCDLGDPRAIAPMSKALDDPNKLVRWRAARFLYETGDHSAVPALRAHADDPEFEVRMQVRLAIERIEGGQAGRGPIWQQMTR